MLREVRNIPADLEPEMDRTHRFLPDRCLLICAKAAAWFPGYPVCSDTVWFEVCQALSRREGRGTIILSSDDLDEEVFTLEIISYKKQGVAITDDCDIDMDYLLNVSKDSVIKKITLNDTFTVDGHTCNEVTEYWSYDPDEDFISSSQNPVSYLLHALGFKKEQKTIAFEQAYIQNGDYIIGVGVRSFNAVQDIENDVLKKDLYKILNSIKFSGNL